MVYNSDPGTPIVDVKSFSMEFGDNRVVKDLTFAIKPGEIFGFLGANGSGKTTTLRALLRLIEPTSGELLIDGKQFNTQDTAKIGYLPEERGLYRKESVIDTMTYLGVLKGLDRKVAKTRALEYLERVGLGDKAKERIGKLSGGQQQKVQLGVTILHEPKLLILDEPTKGLDPVNRSLLMDVINEQRAKGATILLVSHDMEDVERLCDRILMLKDGTSAFYGTVQAIKKAYGSEVIAIKYDGELPDAPHTYTITKKLPHYAEIACAHGRTPDEVLQKLTSVAGLHLAGFEIQQTSLNDIFIAIYKDGA